MKANVYVNLKNSISDPKGAAVKASLNQLGWQEVKEVRMGKLIQIHLDETSKDKAQEKIQAMCEQLLANEVMETFHIEIVEG
jgi:phosphoribosylformylglycinamidine synthase